jgi:hypothetical protein
MRHANIHPNNRLPHLRPVLPTPETKPIDWVLGLVGLVLAVTLLGAWWIVRSPSSTAVLNTTNPAAQEKAPVLNPSIEQNASDLASAQSTEAFQMLIQSLKQSEPLSQRSIAIATLKDASPTVVPMLITALNDQDASVRAGAAQALGLRREYQAIAALTTATRDYDVNVRREAVTSLGVIDAWQVLPRLEQLFVNEPDNAVRDAAIGAKESFEKEMAQAIGVPVPELRDISVTTGDVPQIYAVTLSNLYARNGTAWTLVSRLPDAPLSMATGNNTNLIYLATVSNGLYRSLNGGQTWEHILFGLGTPTQLTVTAIAVDPQNSRQVYIALVSPGVEPGTQNSLGISVSKDSGATWSFLENSPMDVITTRLVIDPQLHGYLFGITMDAPWRYTLPAPSSISANPMSGSASQ